MASEYNSFQEKGVEVRIMGRGEAEEAARLTHRLDPPFPILTDTSGKVYEAYGLGRKMLGVIQQSGTVLLDRTGSMRYSKLATNPMQAFDKSALFNALGTLGDDI